MEKRLLFAVPHDVVRHQVDGVRGKAGQGLSRETDDRAPRNNRRVHHARQIFMVPLHPDMVQVDAGQLGFEIAAVSDSHIGLSATDRGRILGRISEAPDLA